MREQKKKKLEEVFEGIINKERRFINNHINPKE
jgi:hypothetical protein